MKIPKYYEFKCDVKYISGFRVLETVADELKKLNSKKPMFLASRTITKSGVVDNITNQFGKDISVGAYSTEIPQDSDLEVVKKLAKEYTDNGCDSIIAIGGGSVIDTAKGVNIAVSLKCDNFNIMPYSGYDMIREKLKPLIVIPTTSGSGSEVTAVAVIAETSKNKKHLFASNFLLPDIAISDPRMTQTLPKHLTAQTGMDAMTHAIEGFISISKNPISDSLSLEAVKLLSANIKKAVSDPLNEEVRLNMATGSTLAGISFSNSMVGIVHAIGHTIGAICHVSHGTCMAILLAYGLEYNLHKCEDDIAELLLPLAGREVYQNTAPKDRAKKTIEFIRNLNKELAELVGNGFYTCFKDCEDRNGNKLVTEAHFEEIAKNAINDGAITYNIEEADYEDILKIVKAAYVGKPLYN